eukprot:TRINITY_DN100971_c0_g1_i1.p3 TRINITY_DN100971_c0_g1~~TRINITY_DN100971_c0_g1_i1.p3  ORF type:complete len:155 (+),score=34.63 TRINITY_DN100971_c0_g1_i1:111-575(+)
MPTGLVTTWLEEKGFGFIAPDDSSLGDLFVHVSELRDARANGLERGDRVSFEVKYNRDKGKNLAVNVLVEKSGNGKAPRGRPRDSRDRGHGGGRERGGGRWSNGRDDSRRRQSRSRRSQSRRRAVSRSRSKSRSRCKEEAEVKRSKSSSSSSSS